METKTASAATVTLADGLHSAFRRVQLSVSSHYSSTLSAAPRFVNDTRPGRSPGLFSVEPYE